MSLARIRQPRCVTPRNRLIRSLIDSPTAVVAQALLGPVSTQRRGEIWRASLGLVVSRHVRLRVVFVYAVEHFSTAEAAAREVKMFDIIDWNRKNL
jgi:hypothetical protein